MQLGGEALVIFGYNFAGLALTKVPEVCSRFWALVVRNVLVDDRVATTDAKHREIRAGLDVCEHPVGGSLEEAQHARARDVALRAFRARMHNKLSWRTVKVAATVRQVALDAHGVPAVSHETRPFVDAQDCAGPVDFAAHRTCSRANRYCAWSLERH